MKQHARVVLMLALVIVAVNAFAQGAPRIVSITPPSGMKFGGDAVVIKVENMSLACPVCLAPLASIRVLFGTSRSPELRATNSADELIAITPPQSGSVVDVSVINDATHETAIAPHAFTYTSGFERSTVEMVLLPAPLVKSLDGANGSKWTTEFVVRHGGGAQALAFFGDEAQCAFLICSPSAPVPYVQPKTILNPFATSATGALYYVQKSQAGFFEYSLRIRDVSRSQENEGTEIPVVRESELRSRPIHLLNVPLNATSRATLRLFATSIPEGLTPTATINVTMTKVPSIHASAQVVLTGARSGLFDLQLEPGYAAINDLRTTLNLPDTGTGLGGFTVEVIPNGYTGWAYVTVTNNQTQLVTAITPK